MAYCIKCGVELGEGEERCPLCGTPVCHPDIKPDPAQKPYPPYRHAEQVSRQGGLFIMTLVFAMTLVICCLCDVLLHGRATWFHYVLGSLVFLYVLIVLPNWFRSPNPVIFVPVDFAAAAGLLLYISLLTKGGWFLSFALPVTAGAGVIVTAVVTLVRYVHRGHLYIYGGAVIAVGAYIVLIELLLNTAFHIRERLMWSVFPFAGCFLLGMALIIIAICPRLREYFHKKFFI